MPGVMMADVMDAAANLYMGYQNRKLHDPSARRQLIERR